MRDEVLVRLRCGTERSKQLISETLGNVERSRHRGFGRCADACRVSFVELLRIPTVGGSQLVVEVLNAAHLDALNALILRGFKRNVFLSDKVARLMRDSGRFRWLPKPIANQVLPQLHKVGGTTICQHLHFSNYGALQARMTLEAAAIARLRTDSPHLSSCA